MGDINCKALKKNATLLSLSCCQLTHPSLDRGNADCKATLNLPHGRHFTFAELYTINMCIEECNFVGSGYIDADPPYRLDMANIQTNLDKFMPEPKDNATTFMMDAYKKCEIFRLRHSSRYTLHLPDIEFMEEQCNPFALQITICVRILAMQRCPQQFQVNTDNCKMARSYFLQCVVDVESNV
ncbi:uncharacterized protein Obp85a [Drosophila tropicalis]|uniref:uncharacterized protein Obp85a n=1 Tax=Drosophila tropicalis TaxID=46794 RepID=UPI0035ABC2CB